MNPNETQIMNDNIMYLMEWQKHNDSLRNTLQIIGPDLVCEINGVKEQVDISSYYLPDILYNPELRNDLPDSTKIKAENLFQIVKVNILAEELSKLELAPEKIVITKFSLPKDENNQEYIVFEDNKNNKYRLTKNIEEVKSIYFTLLHQQELVELSAFKKELEGLKNE